MLSMRFMLYNKKRIKRIATEKNAKDLKGRTFPCTNVQNVSTGG